MTNQPRPVRAYSSEDMLRQTALDIARFACNLDRERLLGGRKFDSFFVARDDCDSASLCGEMPNLLLKMLGVRDTRLVYHDKSEISCMPWRLGRNIPRMVFPKVGMFVWAKRNLRPQRGDILYMALPERVCVLDELNEQTGTVAVFEYGTRAPQRRKPAVYRSVRRYRLHRDSLYVGNSRLRGWLDLSRIPGLLVVESRSSRATPTFA